MEQTPLEIRILGSMDVRVGGQPLPPLRSRKGYYLLALLALRAGGDVPRSYLAGTLWPDGAEEQAQVSLRRSLADLRFALGDARGRLLAPSARTLRLDLAGAVVDAVAFDDAVRSEDPARWERAVGLYRGPLLEGCTDEWCLQERQWREEAFLAAQERLAERAVGRRDFPAAAAHLRRAVAVSPWRESAWRALMAALAESGDFAGVVSSYRDLRLRLRETLSADPDPETTALYERLRSDARRRAAVSSRLAIAVNTAAPSPSPEPLTDLPRDTPHNLPRPLTSLIGRRAEAEAILSTLCAGARLVTLTGIGGVGKTRLALEAAWQALPDFADGVWFVDLSPVRDDDNLAAAVTAAVGLREQPDRPLPATLAEALRGKRALLVMDNCEHLLLACARFAQEMLSRCSTLHVLATSRQALGIAGETAHPIAPLDVPTSEGKDGEVDRATLPDGLLRYDAVRLFAERATAAQPTFRLTVQNATDTLRICQQLDGIPLALELAAARVKALGVEQVAARLSDRFRLLTTGSPAAQPRQQTLRSLLDWSYDLLSEPERALLRRLTVFAGGCTLEAAEAVCGGEPVAEDATLDLTAQLVDKSMVVTEERAGARRYRLLETVRQYGQERLREAGEAEMLADRHCDWFLRFAETAQASLNGPEHVAWLDRLDADHENLRKALARSVENSVCLRLASALWPYWYSRGHFREGRSWLEGAVVRDADGYARPERALALHGAGQFAWRQGDFAAARQWLTASLATHGILGNDEGVASVQASLGVLMMEQGDYGAAQRHFEESRVLYQGMGHRRGVLRVTVNQGNLRQYEGRYDDARVLLEEAVATAREIGETRLHISSLGTLASIALSEGDEETAEGLWLQCLAMDRELDFPWGIASSLCFLGFVAVRLGQLTEAALRFVESLEVARRLGEPRIIVRCLEGVAALARRTGQPEQAALLLAGASALRERIGLPRLGAQKMEYAEEVETTRAALDEAMWAAAEERAATTEPEEMATSARGTAETIASAGRTRSDRG